MGGGRCFDQIGTSGVALGKKVLELDELGESLAILNLGGAMASTSFCSQRGEIES